MTLKCPHYVITLPTHLIQMNGYYQSSAEFDDELMSPLQISTLYYFQMAAQRPKGPPYCLEYHISRFNSVHQRVYFGK